jgi:tRNA-dihydrouridine synthase
MRPDALTIHARTRKEMSLVPARWEHVAEVVQMAKGSGVPIIGNGDVESLDDGIARASATGADGVMVGRGVFGNPWFFNPSLQLQDISLKKRLEVMLEHTQLFLELHQNRKSFSVMKKHYKAYVHGFDHAKELRMLLMEAESYEEVQTLVADFIRTHENMVSLTPRALG